jgi:hypothetical protein
MSVSIEEQHVKKQYSKNIKTWFSGKCGSNTYPKSIQHIDGLGQLHGEQRDWWDRKHFYPKEISIYHHGTLLRSTQWYLNGLVKYYVAVVGKSKIETGFYPSGKLKYTKRYRLMNKEWVRNDVWCGYYRNSIKHYVEKYNLGTLVSQIRFFSNGNVISKFTLKNPEKSDSSDTSSISSIETEESSLELTEKIFEEEDIDFEYRKFSQYKEI